MDVSYDNKRFRLSNGETITFLRWITCVKGNQYFVAQDKDKKERIYHVTARDDNGNIVRIESVT
jgi:hypothetical protein